MRPNISPNASIKNGLTNEQTDETTHREIAMLLVYLPIKYHDHNVLNSEIKSHYLIYQTERQAVCIMQFSTQQIKTYYLLSYLAVNLWKVHRNVRKAEEAYNVACVYNNSLGLRLASLHFLSCPEVEQGYI